jgi:hypothetical protein
MSTGVLYILALRLNPNMSVPVNMVLKDRRLDICIYNASAFRPLI